MTNNLNVRNNSIDLFRYICAVMVVSIHTAPLSEFDYRLGYITSQILPRIAVPFFFCVAGYFYTKKLESGQPIFGKYVGKIFCTYFIWSCVYFAIDFISWGHSQIKGFILSEAINFFIKGSYYHFWFFPALIISVCITTLLYKLKCKKAIIPLSLVLYAIGCIGCAYYTVGINIPLLGKIFQMAEFTSIRRIFMMGFPFFACGYLINRIKEKISSRTNKQLIVSLAIALIVWLAEITAVIKLSLQRDIIITFALYPLLMIVMLLLIQNPLPQFQKASYTARIVANFTYYAHPLVMLIIKMFYTEIPKTALFLLTLLITFIFGFILSKFNNKFIKSIVG